MSGDRPKVSVLIQTFNHRPWIDQAIRSAVEQSTDFPYEILIGEDDSTDGTRTVVTDWQTRRPDLIRALLHDRNVGGHENFSRLYRAARGHYVAWLEGDDYWTSPDKLRIQAEHLDQHPDLAICFHPVRIVYEDGSARPPRMTNRGQRPVSTLEDLCRGNFIWTPSCMFRHHLMDDLPDWVRDLPLGDWPLHLLNARHGRIGFLDEEMAVYRVHGRGSWSSRPLRNRLEESIRTAEACRDRMALASLNQCIFKWSVASAALSLGHGDVRAAGRHAGRALVIARSRPDIVVGAVFGRGSGRPAA